MLVHADGRFEGSVSGGCVEGEVLMAAGQTIADGKPRRLRYGVSDASAWEVGLPCGGEIALIVQPLSEDGFPPALLEQVAERRAAGLWTSLTTDLLSGRTREGAEVGDERFVRRYQPPRRLFVVGAVQIAQSLVRIARELDVVPVLIDPRARFLTTERFPDTQLDDRWPDDAIEAHGPDSASAIVTLSHDPKIDDPALIAALSTPAAYIAALGSRRSHAARLDRLRQAGVAEDQLGRIDGPAGIAIGALGSAEIALSVAAGMIQAFRNMGS